MSVRDDRHPAEDPVARLIGLATAFEISLAALNMQIEVEACTPITDAAAVTASTIAIGLVAFRQNMRELVGADIMPDSGFDVILELFAMQIRARRMSVMDVCAGLAFSDTATRRWLQKLEHAGVLERHEDPDDHRRDWVSLKPSVCQTVRLLLGRIIQE